MIRRRFFEFVTTIQEALGLDAVDFIKHSKNYLSAEFFAKALGFISIPIITRLLTPDEYGILATFSSVILICSIICGMGFKGAVARYYYEESDDINSFLGSSVVFLVCFNLVVLIGFYLFAESIAVFLNIQTSVLWFAILVSVCVVFFEIYLSLLQASKRSRRYARLAIIKSLLILVISIPWIVFLQSEPYFGKIYGQTVVTGLVFLWAIYKIALISRFKIKKRHLLYALGFGLPLLPHALSGYALAQFDRLIINQLKGSGDTGFYSLAYNIGLIMNVVVMGMNKSWVPVFYEKRQQNNLEDLDALAPKYAIITAMVASLLILFANQIAGLLAPEEYSESFVIIPIIISGYYFVYLYTLYAGYAFYEKKTFLISVNTVIAGSVNIVLNYLFIPEYGYEFAAFTTLLSYILLFLLHYLNVRFVLQEKRMIPIARATTGWIWIIISVVAFYSLYFLEVTSFISIGIELFLGGLIVWILFRRLLGRS